MAETKKGEKPRGGRRKKEPGSVSPVLPTLITEGPKPEIPEGPIVMKATNTILVMEATNFEMKAEPPVPHTAPREEPEIRDDIKDLEVAKKMLKINQSASDRGLAFDLSFKTVKRLMSYKKCYYTNKEFKEDGPFARSFDRVDSSKGYIEGNVVACTVDINGKKSNLSNEEIIILYEKLILKKF